MTSPDNSSAHRPSPPQTYADRAYRSLSALIGGVLLLALAAWLGGDALIRGEGMTRWLAVAGLLFLVPLVVAFTLRPAVFAGADRLRVRNPFRTITLPWGAVEGIRAAFSVEVLAAGRKYQLWAIPVSLRQRKKAAVRQKVRAAATDAGADRAQADQSADELLELMERNAMNESAQGTPVVRWAYEIIAPSVAGAVLLAVLAGLA